MKSKFNKVLTGVNYFLAALGVLFLVLAFNFQGNELYPDLYMYITVALMVLIPISIVLSIIYFIKRRTKGNLLTLLFSILSVSYAATYVYFVLYVIVKTAS